MEEWQDPKMIAVWFLIVLMFIILLIISIIVLVRFNLNRIIDAKMKASKIELEHQQALLKTSIQVQERERDRIAADLHDALIGNLVAIGLMNQVEHEQSALDDLIQSSIQTARRISHDLSPPLIDHTNLSDLIHDKTIPWEKSNAITYYSDVRYEGTVSSEVKIQLIRIVQELMNNIYKHAEATETLIHLRLTDQFLCLRIKENGKGFDTTKHKSGLGLKNIEMRVQYLNGKFKLKSKKQKGSSILIIIHSSKFNHN